MTAMEDEGIDDEEVDKLNDQLMVVTERLDDIGARSAEGRARAILEGLQFSDEMIAGPTKALSGGWRVRVALVTNSRYSFRFEPRSVGLPGKAKTGRGSRPLNITANILNRHAHCL